MISIISTTYDSATLVIVSYTAVSDLQASLKKTYNAACAF